MLLKCLSMTGTFVSSTKWQTSPRILFFHNFKKSFKLWKLENYFSFTLSYPTKGKLCSFDHFHFKAYHLCCQIKLIHKKTTLCNSPCIWFESISDFFTNKWDKLMQVLINGVVEQLLSLPSFLLQNMTSYRSGIILKDWHVINKTDIAT